MHEVLVNRLGGLSLPRKSVVRLTDRPGMTLDVYRGRKTTIQIQQLKTPDLTYETDFFSTFSVAGKLCRVDVLRQVTRDGKIDNRFLNF